MKPIKYRDTGRGVEDIQLRLQRLGYNLGTHGVDGDFRDETQTAIKAFQEQNNLPVTGEVDVRTWSALVDSTFVFGDRSLYLRRPHFHGQDVMTLQSALVALGFSGGDIDGIFGPHTERAVIEFQQNMGISPDGAAGQQTYEALNGLKHIWDNREVFAHSAATRMTQNREPVLMNYSWCFASTGSATQQIVRRLVNLASASAEQATISHQLIEADGWQPPSETISIVIAEQDATQAPRQITIPYNSQRAVLIKSLQEALHGRTPTKAPITIVVPTELLNAPNKLHFQFMAAVILDTLCVVFE